MNIDNGIFVPVIIGLVEIVKRLGLPGKFSPLLALALGVGFSLISGEVIFETILSGIVFGLAASGLYSGTKAIVGK